MPALDSSVRWVINGVAAFVCVALLMMIAWPGFNVGPITHDSLVTCTNRQEEIAKAILVFNQTHDRFPGYQTRVLTGGGAGARQAELKSWIVAALETIKKDDYDAIRHKADPQPKRLKIFQCPLGTSADDESINYVANCGRKDSKATASVPYDWKSNGVFMRENLQAGAGVREEVVRLQDFVDPASRTIMISENLQATRWTELGEPDIGIVWFAEDEPNTPKPECRRINVGAKDRLKQADYDHARPSSNHPGGVVVVFCDASSKFLSEKVEYGAVYCKLMTPDGRNAKEPGTNTLVKEFFRMPFDEKLLE